MGALGGGISQAHECVHAHGHLPRPRREWCGALPLVPVKGELWVVWDGFLVTTNGRACAVPSTGGQGPPGGCQGGRDPRGAAREQGGRDSGGLPGAGHSPCKSGSYGKMSPLVLGKCWHPGVVINAAGGTHVWRVHHFFQWPLPKCLQPKELGCLPKQPSFPQAEHHAMPLMPAAPSAALPGSTEGPALGCDGGHQDEIPCSHECTPKGAAWSILCAASDLGSAQVREERAWATRHLECHLGTGEPPWLPAAWSSHPFGVTFAFLAAVTLPKRG